MIGDGRAWGVAARGANANGNKPVLGYAWKLGIHHFYIINANGLVPMIATKCWRSTDAEAEATLCSHLLHVEAGGFQQNAGRAGLVPGDIRNVLKLLNEDPRSKTSSTTSFLQSAISNVQSPFTPRWTVIAGVKTAHMKLVAPLQGQ